MTILLAHTEDDHVWVATDSRWFFDEDYYIDNFKHKFLETTIKHLVIAQAGEHSFAEIAQDSLESWEDEIREKNLTIDTKLIRKLSKKIKDRAQALKVGESKPNELPSHNNGLLIAYRNRIWTVYEDYSVLEFTDQLIASDGCHADLVIDAVSLLWDLPYTAKERMTLAIKQVFKHRSGAGGELYFRRT